MHVDPHNPLCKWFRESFYNQFLSPAVSASFAQETMSFHSPLKRSKTSAFPLNPRSQQECHPNYTRQTMSRLNEPPPEDYVVGCTVCGSKAIEEIEFTHHDSPPKLLPHSCPEISSVQSNSGAYVQILERTVEPAFESDREGKIVKNLHFIDGTQKIEHEPFINVEDESTSKKISTVFYKEVTPSEHTPLTPLNYVEVELLKQSLYKNTVAELYVKEDERKRVAVRRHEYANRKKGVSKTMMMRTFTDRDGAAFTADEIALLEKIRENRQDTETNSQVVHQDLLKPKYKLSSSSFRSFKSPGLSRISKSNAGGSFIATPSRSKAPSVNLQFDEEKLETEKPLSFKQAMLSHLRRNFAPPKTVWNNSAEKMVLSSVKSKLPKPVQKSKFPLQNTIDEGDPDLEDFSPFNSPYVNKKSHDRSASSGDRLLDQSRESKKKNSSQDFGNKELWGDEFDITLKKNSFEGISKKNRDAPRHGHTKSNKQVAFEINEEDKMGEDLMAKYSNRRRTQLGGSMDTKMQELARMLSDENLLKGLKFLGAFAEYLEQCPEL